MCPNKIPAEKGELFSDVRSVLPQHSRCLMSPHTYLPAKLSIALQDEHAGVDIACPWGQYTCVQRSGERGTLQLQLPPLQFQKLAPSGLPQPVLSGVHNAYL